MGSQNLKEIFSNLELSGGTEWVNRIDSVIAEQSSLIQFADGAKTMAHLYFAQSRKTDAKLLKISALYGLTAGIAYLEARKLVGAVAISTWLRDEFPNHQITRVLNERILAQRSPAAPTAEAAKLPKASAPVIEGENSSGTPGFYLELFDGMPMNEVSQLLKDVKLRKVKAGEIIFNQGDKPEKFFILISGQVEIVLDTGLILQFKDQDFFGEIAVLLGQKEIRATAKAKLDSELLEFSKIQLVEAFIKFPSLEERLLRFAFLRAFWNLASQIDVLKKYKRGELIEFFDSFVPVRFKKDQTLFHRLSMASGLYLIIEGQVQIRDDEHEVAKVGPGAFIGEMSLLEFGQHIAEAVALTPGHALLCPPQKFQLMMKKFPRFHLFLREVSNQRKQELQAIQLTRCL